MRLDRSPLYLGKDVSKQVLRRATAVHSDSGLPLFCDQILSVGTISDRSSFYQQTYPRCALVSKIFRPGPMSKYNNSDPGRHPRLDVSGHTTFPFLKARSPGNRAPPHVSPMKRTQSTSVHCLHALTSTKLAICLQLLIFYSTFICGGLRTSHLFNKTALGSVRRL